MENNDIKESEEIIKSPNHNDENDKNVDLNHDDVMPEIQQEQLVTSQILAVEKNSDVFVKLKQREKNIYEKLMKKRQQLQLHTNNLEQNSDKAKENDMKVLKVLQDVYHIRKEKPCNKSAKIYLSNETLPNGVTRRNEDILHQHTKKELAGLVEGLQELVFKLTSNDTTLKSKAEKIARNISCLQNFNLFVDNLDNGPSTSGVGRQRHDSDFCQQEQITKQNKVKTELSPSEMFVEYINSMLAEYFGEQQQYKINKYKCLPAHLEDLESFAVMLVEAGIGIVLETEIRINRKNNHQSFVTMSMDRESNEKDGMILLPVARRYALEGDIVRVFVLHSLSVEDPAFNRRTRKISSNDTEKNDSLQVAENDEILNETESSRKAFVIKIVKQTELREVVGSISFMNYTNLNSISYYKLRPHDTRLPMIFIPKELCKEALQTIDSTDVCGMLYVARILDTDINGNCIGELIQPVGQVGNLQAEIKAILLHNGFKDIKPYEQKFHKMFEGPMPEASDKELKYREDLRKKCVFTIDPLTAKDLDDAVSVEKLTDLEYEIGVHISDVSFYLEENSELDNLVKHRATSIYLVNEVIHMLPPSLCFRCSLLPGEDKYTFSVFWLWHTEKEELSAPRFTRSIINSCSQFAYEHAQKIIDNPTEELGTNDFPDLLNGWTPNDIKWRVLFLHEITQKLKAKRYENGALSINNPKLRFQLDPKTGEPLAYEIEGRKEANFLIEELMLLANQSVAGFIHKSFPDTSILRNHSPPLAKSLKALKDRLHNMGLEFDISSSKSIYESVNRLCREADDPKAVEACLSALLTKPMARARYYCSEGKTSEADFWHYALSIPIYTHFTSPIRRYPDILVHRLLAAALKYCPPPQRTTEELHHLAKICNDQKLNAKNAGDESIELFFKRYVKAKQPLTLRAVVTEISKQRLDVLTIETGHTIPISYKLQKVLVDAKNEPSSVTFVEKNSQLRPIKIQLFSTVDINIVLRKEKIFGYLATPDITQRRLNSKECSKKDINTLSHNNYATDNGVEVGLQGNSMSEQENDNTQTSSSISKEKKEKRKIKRKQRARYFALSNN